MSDWQPGDRAICMDTEERPSSVETEALRRLDIGAAYTVARLHPSGNFWLVEVPTDHAFYADRFSREAA